MLNKLARHRSDTLFFGECAMDHRLAMLPECRRMSRDRAPSADHHGTDAGPGSAAPRIPPEWLAIAAIAAGALLLALVSLVALVIPFAA